MNPNLTPKTILLRVWFTPQARVAHAMLSFLALASVCTFGASDTSAQLFQRESDKAQDTQSQAAKDAQLKAAKNVFGINDDAQGNSAQDAMDQEVDPDGWEIVKPTGANAIFRMPIKPRYVEKSFSPIIGRPPIIVRMHIATENKNRSSVLSYHDLHDEPIDKTDVKGILEGAVKGSVVRVLGRLDQVKDIKVDGNPGREFNYSYTQDEKVHRAVSRVILVGQRQYQLTVLSAEGFDEPVANEKFLTSLICTEPVEALTSENSLSSETSQSPDGNTIRK